MPRVSEAKVFDVATRILSKGELVGPLDETSKRGSKPAKDTSDEPMSELHRITSDPALCGGRPCLRGLRVRVKDVLDLLAAGATHEEILEDFPYLESADITAALEYAAVAMDHLVLRSA